MPHYQVARTIGGAGTGKTTELIGILEKLVDQLGDPLRVGFVSLTRNARREAADRAARRGSMSSCPSAPVARDKDQRSGGEVARPAVAGHRAGAKVRPSGGKAYPPVVGPPEVWNLGAPWPNGSILGCPIRRGGWFW
jgi:hypothetical protein